VVFRGAADIEGGSIGSVWKLMPIPYVVLNLLMVGTYYFSDVEKISADVIRREKEAETPVQYRQVGEDEDGDAAQLAFDGNFVVGGEEEDDVEMVIVT